MMLIVNIFIAVLAEAWGIFYDAAPFLLLGFAGAGILYVLLPSHLIAKHLGGRDFSSVLKAALFGAPMPLCSCGVVPTALSLRKQGASPGATLSFLISTPETGVDSVLVSYALLDPIMTVFRPVAAMVTAISAGLVANKTDRSENPVPVETNNCAVCDVGPGEVHQHGWKEKIRAMLKYAFVDFLGDLAKSLIVGMLIAGIISYFLPANVVEKYLGNELLSMLAMLVVGIPSYICATASTPIAAAFILKGLSPGAALVFLLTGPATNAASLIMVARNLGRRTALVYLVSIAVTALAMGVLLNMLYAAAGINASAIVGKAGETVPESLKWVSAAVLTGLLLNAFWRTDPSRKEPCCLPTSSSTSDHACCQHDEQSGQ